MNSHLYRDINDVIRSGFFANEKVNVQGSFRLTQSEENMSAKNFFFEEGLGSASNVVETRLCVPKEQRPSHAIGRIGGS